MDDSIVERKSKIATTRGAAITMIGGLVTAFFASICCIGPVVFAALGVGLGATGFLAGAAGFLSVLLPYRTVFIGLTTLLVGISLYLAYRSPKSTLSRSGDICVPGVLGRANRTLLWALAVLAIVLIVAPYWL